jgi:hypothetical protein
VARSISRASRFFKRLDSPDQRCELSCKDSGQATGDGGCGSARSACEPPGRAHLKAFR